MEEIVLATACLKKVERVGYGFEKRNFQSTLDVEDSNANRTTVDFPELLFVKFSNLSFDKKYEIVLRECQQEELFNEGRKFQEPESEFEDEDDQDIGI